MNKNIKLLVFFVISAVQFSIYAETSIGALTKLCNFSSLSKEDKSELIKFAYENYLPEEYKRSLERGVSNFKIVSSKNAREYNKNCSNQAKNEKLCISLIGQTRTFYKYDIGIALEGILSFISSQRNIIQNIENVCPRFDEEVQLAVKELDPSRSIEQFLSKKDLNAIDSSIAEIGIKLNLKFNDRRVHNPVSKSDPFSESTVYKGYKINCVGEEKFNLNILDKTQFLGLELMNKVTKYFSPKMPLAKK